MSISPVGVLRGSARYDDFRSTRTFGALDGLRALSVIAVIWQHTSGNPGPEFFSKGGFGVEFFFAISGFLITTLLLRERDREGRISLRGFYARRTFRIMPLYYLVLAVYVVLTLGLRADTEEGRGFIANLPAFATYTSNWFVDLDSGDTVTFYFAWSLATEEQFYLFWPPFLVLCFIAAGSIGRGALALPLALLGSLVLIGQLAIASSSDALAVTILASLSLPILLGSAAALLLHRRRVFEAVAPVLSAPWCAPLLAAVMLASLVWDTPKQLTQVSMVLLVASLCVTERTVLHPALRWRPLAHIGVVSYGIYLMHMLCANALRLVLPEHYGVALFAGTTLLVVAVASASHRWIETPLVAAGRRLSARLQERQAAKEARRKERGPAAGAVEVT